MSSNNQLQQSRTIRSSNKWSANPNPNGSFLWQDKYKPKNVKDIPAYSLKKKAVRDWILKSKTKAEFQRTLPSNSPNYKPSVLVLCGCSGCCKSTLVEVTAKELHVPIVEWHEDLLENGGGSGLTGGAPYNPFLSAQEYAESLEQMGGGDVGGMTYRNNRDLSDSKSSVTNDLMMDDLNDFAIRSSYSALQCTTTSTNGHKLVVRNSRTQKSSSLKKSSQSVMKKSGNISVETKKRKAPYVISLDSDDNDGSDEGIDDFDDDDGEFGIDLKQLPTSHSVSSSNRSIHRSDSIRSSSSSSSVGSGYGSADSSLLRDPYSLDSEFAHHIILIHDPSSLLPDQHPTSRLSDCIRTKMRGEGICSQLLKFKHPVVLIVSDTGEREITHWTINELIPKHIQECIDLEVVYCTPITVINAKKILKQISDEEVSKSTQMRMIKPADSVLESIANACLGDLRQAISQLQMHMLGESSASTNSAVTSGDPEAGSRDKSYSFLHGVAKLLWAKVSTAQRVADLSTSDDISTHDIEDISRYRLNFPPDSVIRRLDLPLDMGMSFLQFNYPPIFEQMEAKNERAPSNTCQESSLPAPTYDALERAERFSDMLSEADMLHTCQYSTNLPIDRAENSSFPKEYVESICSRAAACSMYPTKKTSSLFSSYNDSRRQRIAFLADKKTNGSICDSYDHLTGTHGGITLKKTSSTSSNGEKSNFGMTAIRRPTSLDVRQQAISVANMTRDLRAAMVTNTPAPSFLHDPSTRGSSRPSPPAVPCEPILFKSFDYVAKQSARICGGNSVLRLASQSNLSYGNNHREDECLPVSFLTSTELITVVVPYLKYFLAMQNTSNVHPIVLHPNIQKHVTTMMGKVTVDSNSGDADSVDDHKSSVLIGRHRSNVARKQSEETLLNERHDSHATDKDTWNFDDDDDLEEFSD